MTGPCKWVEPSPKKARRRCSRTTADASIGATFGRLRVIELSHRSAHGQAYMKCQCTCGEVVVVRLSMLVSSNTRSCGCLYRERRYGRHYPKNTKSRWARLQFAKYLDEQCPPA